MAGFGHDLRLEFRLLADRVLVFDLRGALFALQQGQRLHPLFLGKQFKKLIAQCKVLGTQRLDALVQGLTFVGFDELIQNLRLCGDVAAFDLDLGQRRLLNVRGREQGQIAELDGFHVRPVDHRTQCLGDGVAPLNDVFHRLTLRGGQEQHHCALRDQQQHHGGERNGKPGGDF